jgi:hypothetical protein
VTLHRQRIAVAFLVLTLILAVLAGSRFAPAAQEAQQPDILASTRVFPDVGPGLIAVKRDQAGRYYVAASPANAVSIFGPDGKRIGQVPDPNAGATANAKIAFAADFDIDSAGHLLVADRGANAIKIFAPDGSLLGTIPIPAPTSIAALPGEEFAVTSLRYRWLMAIYSYGGNSGKLVRVIGEPKDFAPGFDPSHTPDLGRVTADPAGNIYFAFAFLPVPTVRRFDRFGYAGNEIIMDEFAVGSRHRELFPSGSDDNRPPAKIGISALAVDPVTQEIWVALGNELLRFDKDGARIGSYRPLSPARAPLVPKTILVEPERLLLGTESWGIFAFVRPDKSPPARPRSDH